MFLAYGAGTASVFIISLCSLIGAVFVKFTREVVKQYAMGMLLSLSIGCLVGDAVLHLIPEVRNNTNYEMVVSKWKKRKQTTTHYCKIFKMKLKNLKNRGKPIPLTYIFK